MRIRYPDWIHIHNMPRIFSKNLEGENLINNYRFYFNFFNSSSPLDIQALSGETPKQEENVALLKFKVTRYLSFFHLLCTPKIRIPNSKSCHLQHRYMNAYQ